MSDLAYWLSRVRTREGIGPKELVALGGMDPYNQHRALYALFDLPDKEERKGQPAPFLFRFDEEGGRPAFLVLSCQKPEDRLGRWCVESKPYAPAVRAGDLLDFRLRANPVVARAEEKGQRGKRHDVVMDAKLHMNWKDIPPSARPSLPQVAYEAGAKWLLSRAGGMGVSFEEKGLRVDGYQVWRQPYGKRIELAILDFEGRLTVSAPEKLSEALFHGVGPAKGFGCGLLLVRRVREGP
jgi:CRISPR system Cascade subunit CasE